MILKRGSRLRRQFMIRKIKLYIMIIINIKLKFSISKKDATRK